MANPITETINGISTNFLRCFQCTRKTGVDIYWPESHFHNRKQNKHRFYKSGNCKNCVCSYQRRRSGVQKVIPKEEGISPPGFYGGPLFDHFIFGKGEL